MQNPEKLIVLAKLVLIDQLRLVVAIRAWDPDLFSDVRDLGLTELRHSWKKSYLAKFAPTSGNRRQRSSRLNEQSTEADQPSLRTISRDFADARTQFPSAATRVWMPLRNSGSSILFRPD